MYCKHTTQTLQNKDSDCEVHLTKKRGRIAQVEEPSQKIAQLEESSDEGESLDEGELLGYPQMSESTITWINTQV